MNRLFPLLICAFMALPMGSAYAQSQAGALFLRIAPDARSSGMGETGVAHAEGAMASAWNPGALGFSKTREFTGNYFKWLPYFNFDDMYFLHFGYVQPVEGIGTFGISVPYLSLGEQPATDASGNSIGTINSFDVAVNLSYGTQVGEVLGLGTNLKVIYNKLSPFSAGAQQGRGTATTFAVDLGAMYKIHDRLTLGGAVQNLGPKITFIDADQGDPLPRTLKLGFAAKLIDGEHNRLMLAHDFNKGLETGSAVKTLRESVLNTGAEYWYSDFVALRAGYIYDRAGNIKTPTFGGGLQWRLYRIDFSYVTSSTLQDITKFSVTVGF